MRRFFTQAEQLLFDLVVLHREHGTVLGSNAKLSFVRAQIFRHNGEQRIFPQLLIHHILAAHLGRTHGDCTDDIALGVHLHAHLHGAGSRAVLDGLQFGLPAHADDIVVSGICHRTFHHITHHGQRHTDGGNDGRVFCDAVLMPHRFRQVRHDGRRAAAAANEHCIARVHLIIFHQL